MPENIKRDYSQREKTISNLSLIICEECNAYIVYCVCNRYVSYVLRGSELHVYFFVFFACNAIKCASYMINDGSAVQSAVRLLYFNY